MPRTRRPVCAEQMGLRPVATKGPVQALMVDSADRPSEN
jgi:hypothetical protein